MVDAGPEPMYEEQMRAQPLGYGSLKFVLLEKISVKTRALSDVKIIQLCSPLTFLN